MKKYFLLLSIAIISLLNGCMTPTAPEEIDNLAKMFQGEPDTASVYVVFPNSVVLEKYAINFNGGIIGEISKNKYLWIIAKPRKKNFIVGGISFNEPITFETLPERLYFFEVKTGYAKVWLEQIDEERGKELIKSARLIEKINTIK